MLCTSSSLALLPGVPLARQAMRVCSGSGPSHVELHESEHSTDRADRMLSVCVVHMYPAVRSGSTGAGSGGSAANGQPAAAPAASAAVSPPAFGNMVGSLPADAPHLA